jgi:uncharacterized protein (TIGR03083 family)
MADLGTYLAAERRTMADLAGSLTGDQLQTPSLCDGWTVRDVLAHLTLSVTYKASTVGRAMVRARGRFPQAVILLTAQAAERTTPELADLLRDRAESTWGPPGFGTIAPLTDIVVHGVDIRRPLGLAHAPDPGAIRRALDFSVGRKAGTAFTKRRHLTDLRFEATDQAWSHGSGPVVRGPSLELLAAICGRTAVLDDLDGDGVAVLRARLGA